MFSLPINPFLDGDSTNNVYIPFLRKYRDVIDSVYFTCRIPPFLQDSMGAVVDGQAEHVKLIKQGLYVQEKSGVPAVAVFNSPVVSPSIDNLNVFAEYFRPL